MDDDELIANLAGGDDTALRELFTRHAPWLAVLVYVDTYRTVNLGPAQQAAVSALLTAAGVPAQSQALNGPPPVPQVTAAANRFAALSPAARHAWLAAHLPALRADHLTPAQLP